MTHRRRARLLPLGLFSLLGLILTGPRPAHVQPTLVISPPSGSYTTSQRFDLALLLFAPGRTVAGGQATLDGQDVTAALASCVVPGTILAGGQSFRCPGLSGGALGAGPHTLAVSIDLSGGGTVASSVTWQILPASP